MFEAAAALHYECFFYMDNENVPESSDRQCGKRLAAILLKELGKLRNDAEKGPDIFGHVRLYVDWMYAVEDAGCALLDVHCADICAH